MIIEVFLVKEWLVALCTPVAAKHQALLNIALPKVGQEVIQGEMDPLDSADNIRGNSGYCTKICWCRFMGLNSESGAITVPAWLLMASPRSENFLRMSQLCQAARRFR